MTVKPLNALNQAISSRVIVELRAGREFRGTLDGYDVHMNLVLRDAEEIINGEVVARSETTIVRGDNVIYISP
ncbi:MAG: LSM domain-containing protein [Thermoplasmatota archaeon]